MNFSVLNKNPEISVAFQERKKQNGVLLLDVEMTLSEPKVPEQVVVGWTFPCTDIYSIWRPNNFPSNIGPDWSKRVSSSRLASGAPFYAMVSFAGENRMTIAVSDAQTPIEIAVGVCEETAEVACEVRFFTKPINSISSYHATIYIDTRSIRYEEALKEADHFLAKDCGYPSAYIPDAAKRPMYSCWYSYHQNIDVDAIVEECKLAKEYGMESVIVDDGWQTDNSERGYAYCGDWEVCPTKIADMRNFIDRVHECGMKFILWYSVPFVGIYSKAYERFSDMFLDGTKEVSQKDWARLDPRYPEVRQYLTDIFVRAQKEWGLDGFKLDFIDFFKLYPQTKIFDPRWDTLSLEDGIDRLLSEVTDALRAVNPDVLIEFRQSYFGPAIRKYGNMIRVTDCPNDPLSNHVAISNMKFVLDRTPIHSDMLMWNPNDTVESVAHQIICILFSVPQISVLLEKIPEAHRKTLKFWLTYWNENRDILLDGDFSAKLPEHLYTQIQATKNGHTIAVAHGDPIFKVSENGRIDFINNTGEELLLLRAEKSIGEKQYRILDCMGNETASGKVNLSAGTCDFKVPKCGMLQLV